VSLYQFSRPVIILGHLILSPNECFVTDFLGLLNAYISLHLKELVIKSYHINSNKH
jgi:hypothetical protein